MKSNPSTVLKSMGVLAALAILVACSSDNSPSTAGNPTTASFRITLTNITHSQPLSPAFIVLHGDDYSAWEVGATASQALETLAESGSPADLVQATEEDPDVFATATGAGVLLPGGSQSIDLTVTTAKAIHLTMASMLVNTNDAFGGLNGRSLIDLAVGQSVTFMAPAYDAGTEANTEGAATVPGPAAGGEGLNAQRDDVDFVRIHPGVISNQDGLAGSSLNGTHRWDNPVLTLVAMRTG